MSPVLRRWLVIVLALAAPSCAVASAGRQGAAAPHEGPFGFAARAGWHARTTGLRTAIPQAPIAWATTLPGAAPSAADAWTTLVPRLRSHRTGIVLVAVVDGRPRGHAAREAGTWGFPRRRLPLRLRDMAVQDRWEGQPGPDIVQLVETARVHGSRLQVDAYFGSRHPSRRRLAAAQRELATLAVPRARRH